MFKEQLSHFDGTGATGSSLTGPESFGQATNLELEVAPEQPTRTVRFDFSGDHPAMIIDGRTITEFEQAEICALRMLLLMYPDESVISNTDLWGRWVFTDYSIKHSKVFTKAFGDGFYIKNILNVLVPKLEQLDIPGLSFESVRGGGIAVHNPYKDLVALYFSQRGQNASVFHIETADAPVNQLQKKYVETLLASYGEAPGLWLTAEMILQRTGRKVTAHTVGGVLNSLRTVKDQFYGTLRVDSVGMNCDLIIQILVEKIDGKDRAKFRINPQILLKEPGIQVTPHPQTTLPVLQKE